MTNFVKIGHVKKKAHIHSKYDQCEDGGDCFVAEFHLSFSDSNCQGEASICVGYLKYKVGIWITILPLYEF